MSTERQSDLRLNVGSQVGPYKILRLVNRGKTSAVYRAHAPRLGRDIALKILQPGLPLTPDLIACFTQEVRAIAALKHPNLIRVYDYGTYRSAGYVVMEWIAGSSLRDMLSSRPTGLDREDTDRLFGEIASGVASAHDHNIIHGNIKPDNVLLDTSQRPVLTDFSVSCMRRSIALAEPVNAAVYLSPEQARGGPLTPACDIYALGVLLYEMVTGTIPCQGKPPFSDSSESVLLPPSRIRVGLDPRIDQVVLTALSLDPSERYASVRDMIGDLQRRVTVGVGYDTVTLGRSTAEQVRRARAEIRRFERSRADEKPQSAEDTSSEVLSQFSSRNMLPLVGAGILILVVIILVVLWAA